MSSNRTDFVGKAILEFIDKAEGNIIIWADAAKQIGVHFNTIGRHVRRLRADGKIKVVGNRRYEVVKD